MRALSMIVLLLTLHAGCEDASTPPNAAGEGVVQGAPTTPAAQLEALYNEARAAATREDWTRVEVILEVLAKLAPDEIEIKHRLQEARRRRRTVKTLADVTALVEAGATQSARARLKAIPVDTLVEAELMRYRELEAWLKDLDTAKQ